VYPHSVYLEDMDVKVAEVGKLTAEMRSRTRELVRRLREWIVAFEVGQRAPRGRSMAISGAVGRCKNVDGGERGEESRPILDALAGYGEHVPDAAAAVRLAGGGGAGSAGRSSCRLWAGWTRSSRLPLPGGAEEREGALLVVEYGQSVGKSPVEMANHLWWEADRLWMK
jgi:hypothetical protein